jgi:tRNA threonylcarbamoyladenosine biosynthesis protein TsaB
MYILSLESSTKNFALALGREDRVLRTRNYTANQLLEDSIIPAINGILTAAKIPFKKIDGFAVGLGPGSFTSLRVGLSTVKGFALATGKPVIGVGSLDIIAHGVAHFPCDEICVMLDARRNMVYYAIFEKKTRGLRLKGGYQLAGLDAMLAAVHGRTLFVGDGLSAYQNSIAQAYVRAESGCQAIFAAEKFWFPDPSQLAKLAWSRFAKKKFDRAESLVPVYLYAQDCQVAAPNQGGKP